MLLGWTVFRVVQFVLALPALVLFFFGGVWYAVWSFVRRPFPSLDEHPILALVQYHTPDFFSFMLLWYYLSPFVAVMLCGLISVTVWKVWFEGRRRDFAPFAKLPPWPLSADQKAPAIVIGEVHHPVEAREIFSPSWLTILERGLYTGVAIFGSRGIRENIGLHEPVCPPASRLASGQSAPSGSGAGARSQGRFLSRHPPNPG